MGDGSSWDACSAAAGLGGFRSCDQGRIVGRRLLASAIRWVALSPEDPWDASWGSLQVLSVCPCVRQCCGLLFVDAVSRKRSSRRWAVGDSLRTRGHRGRAGPTRSSTQCAATYRTFHTRPCCHRRPSSHRCTLSSTTLPLRWGHPGKVKRGQRWVVEGQRRGRWEPADGQHTPEPPRRLS